MSVFRNIIYPGLVKNEGWYANLRTDRGGETYGGIARNFHPRWAGWKYIDAYKRENGPIPRYKKLPIPELDGLHYDYVKRIFWDKYHLDGVRDSDVAHLVYDMLFQHGRGGTLVQRAVKAVGGRLNIDGAVGPKTVAAINSVSASRLFEQLKQVRRAYFDYLVAKDPEFAEPHYDGWINRLNSFQKKNQFQA